MKPQGMINARMRLAADGSIAATTETIGVESAGDADATARPRAEGVMFEECGR